MGHFHIQMTWHYSAVSDGCLSDKTTGYIFAHILALPAILFSADKAFVQQSCYHPMSRPRYTGYIKTILKNIITLSSVDFRCDLIGKSEWKKHRL